MDKLGESRAAAQYIPIVARHCVFCGAEGRMSEEHVFGKWLLDFELETHPVPHASGGINTFLSERGPFVPFTQVVRVVCQRCNNGWLGQLEADAKEALTSILHGRVTELSMAAAERVATWAFKTALVSMQTFSREERSSGVGVPESEYRALYASRASGLPPDTRAWFGRYEGGRVSSVWVVPEALRLDDVEVEPGFPQGYLSTLVVGPLIVQAFRWTTPMLALDLNLGPKLSPLSPAVTEVSWSPDLPAVGDDELIEVALGRRLSTTVPRTTLRPWGPAADGPGGELVDGRVRMQVLCRSHTVEYPYELVVAASEGREHVFWAMCPCGQAYLIQTETDAAHLRQAGSPSAISSLYDELPGEPIIIEDHLGLFACKRLVR